MEYKLFENFNDVVNKMENEGIGYFITSYCTANDMPDEKSKELFAKAEKALNEFESYIYKKANSEYIEE